MPATYKRIIEERLSHELYSNDYIVKDSATEGTSRILISEFIDLILADSPTEEYLAKILNDLAPEFSTQYSYTSGNIVTYQEQLYEFTASKPAGNWDSSKVTQKSVSQLIADVKSTLGTRIDDEATARQQADTQLASGIGKQMSNLADFYDTTTSYVIGDVVMQQSGDLLRCIAPTSGAFDITKWESVTVDELFDDLNFSAEAISYDNTTSGLEADDVQDAIDETITKLSAVGSASGDIASSTDGSDLPMPKLEVAIEPVQDLHGYDAPWVGGAGKNKLPLTVDGIKAVNTYHSWSGNSTTINNVTITIETDSVGNVTGIRFNGTASADITFNLASNITIPNGSYVWSNDQIVNISNLWLSLTSPNIAITLSSEKERNVTVSNGSIGSAYIYASSGNAFNNVVFKPMIRLATVTDATFAPYSNICPIIGWDEVNVTRTGKNHFDKTTFTVKKFLTSDGRIETSDNWSISDYIGVKGGTAYILSGVTNAGTVAYHCFYDKDKNFISSVISTTQNFTTPSNAVYVRLSMRTETPDAVQLEYGNTATAYEPYNPNSTTYTIDLDGTRYGGKVDLVSGVMTITHKEIDLGDKSWNKTSVATGIPYGYFSTNISDMPVGATGTLCSNYGESSVWATDKKYRISSSSSTLFIIDSDYINGTSSQFKDAMSGVTFVYPLIEPQTYQLTPTVVKSLKGKNNVYADSGAILDAEYIRDLTTVLSNLGTTREVIYEAPNNGGTWMDSQGKYINLTKTIDNFDEIEVVAFTTEGDNNYYYTGSQKFVVADLLTRRADTANKGMPFRVLVYRTTGLDSASLSIILVSQSSSETAKKTIICNGATGAYGPAIHKIYGIKY